MSLSDLPTLNACLNLLATFLLVRGYVFIRQGRETAHARTMVAAFATSVLFLISYLTYHYNHPTTKFQGEGALKVIYLSILLTHIVLAVFVPPLALRTLYLAARKRWKSHKRWARWTFPIWMYVSITGVIVYLMLYVFVPADAP